VLNDEVGNRLFIIKMEGGNSAWFRGWPIGRDSDDARKTTVKRLPGRCAVPAYLDL
jgi:hypothetical protein